MILRNIEINNCRNIKNIYFEPDENLTVISGNNGQGKTNLLECIWLLTGSKSFRSSKDIQLVKENEEFGTINANILSLENSKKAIKLNICGSLSAKKGRYAKINDVDYGRASSIAGIFTAVVFEPDHLRLVKGSPEGRRKFIDAAMCQLYPGYVGIIKRFQRALNQKNALLKNYYKTPDADFILDSFDEEIAFCGNQISKRRSEYLKMCIPLAEQFYSEISDNKEKMSINFISCCEEGKLKELLLEQRKLDIKTGFSTKGPHREDIEIIINEKSAKMFGSQGQQRSSVLALKLAEATCAENICKNHPVMLFDDVLSELDEVRQAYLLNKMEGKQCFVTTCDPSAFKRTSGKIINISDGLLIEN